jgi:hypothetical protein
MYDYVPILLPAVMYDLVTSSYTSFKGGKPSFPFPKGIRRIWEMCHPYISGYSSKIGF